MVDRLSPAEREALREATPVQEFIVNEHGVEQEVSPDGTRLPTPLQRVQRNGSSADGNSFGAVAVGDFRAEEREAMIPVYLRGATDPLMLKVVYDPNLLTEDTNAAMNQMAEDGDAFALARTISMVVLDWGAEGPLVASELVYDEKNRVQYDDRGRPKREERVIVPAGKVIPLDPEYMRYLRSSFLISLWRGINEDVLGDLDPNSSKRSRRRSSTPGSRR